MKHCWVSSFDYFQSWTMFLLLFLLLNKLRERLHRDPFPVHSWRAMLVATRCRKMIRHSKFSNYRRDDYQSSAIYNQTNLNTPKAYFTLRCQSQNFTACDFTRQSRISLNTGRRPLSWRRGTLLQLIFLLVFFWIRSVFGWGDRNAHFRYAVGLNGRIIHAFAITIRQLRIKPILFLVLILTVHRYHPKTVRQPAQAL